MFPMGSWFDNNVFGRTLNPHSKLLTGGEGVFLALRGSIRVPLWCSRPHLTRDRRCLFDSWAHSDLTPGLHSLSKVDKSKQTPGNLQSAKKLRAAVAQNDGVYTPSPPIRIGLNQVVDIIRGNKDIQIVHIDRPDVKSHYDVFAGYIALSGSDCYYEQLERTGEPAVLSLTATGLLSLPVRTLQGLFGLNERRAEAAKTKLKLSCDNDLDVVLISPAPHPAVPPDFWTKAAYTSLWNNLGHPCHCNSRGTGARNELRCHFRQQWSLPRYPVATREMPSQSGNLRYFLSWHFIDLHSGCQNASAIEM
ncbi:hypothetical protein DSL72_003022 [Monilinia vaccinii-corymbosi]|uniref:Uncharacterized protein n=1 Tax=Monilinia vaccinii-corymbosi TaxID=61207 RepID=A0A8A3NYN5_9HELO|nr:hypothetical protein DSL72_003022 [Monilinia vaccinii-corymbosi]